LGSGYGLATFGFCRLMAVSYGKRIPEQILYLILYNPMYQNSNLHQKHNLFGIQSKINSTFSEYNPNWLSFPRALSPIFPLVFSVKISKSAQRSQRKCRCSECAQKFQSSFAPFAPTLAHFALKIGS
jgi:hypothetical protein